jgi:GTP-binding protein
MPQRLVAIVGRPNVGKSTLFNRIVGHREAIVHDMPGVTRDRHYSQAEWTGHPFMLVDTGGFVPESEDQMEAAIREQAMMAIEEADVILFVVDSRDGLIPSDRDIAAMLRESGKKIILVVNKIDGDKQETAKADFYALGLGEPWSVSALGGRRIGDLLDVVTEDFPTNDADDTAGETPRIAVIGKPNVGKSSFVNALLGEQRHIVTNIPGTTRDPIDAVLRHHGREIIMVDTAGLKRRSKISGSLDFFSSVRTLKAIDRCDVAIIMIDAQQGLEHQDLRILETAMERRRCAVLVVNKWDLLEKDDTTAGMLEKELRKRLRQYDFIPIIFVSALTKQRVFKVIDMALDVDTESRRRISTSELNDQLGEDIRRRPPHSKSGKEIKVSYITQVRTKPPMFAFFCNNPALIDETYKRFLENRIREHYAFTGVPLVLAFKKKGKRERQ